MDDLIENRQSVQTDDYCYFDPKQFKPTDQVPRNKAVFQEAIVFIVGGGNYIEYQNLTDYVKVKQKNLLLFMKHFLLNFFFSAKGWWRSQ